jgi:signal transduction histidine kinase
VESRRANRVLLERRSLDAALALALSVVMQTHLVIGRHDPTLALDVAGGLFLTLPLAARRRAPFALASVFAAAAALNAILGGALLRGEPPPVPSLIAGAVVFYSLGAYAEHRRAILGAVIGIAGLWVDVIANGQIDSSFAWSAGFVLLPWLVGRNIQSRSLRVVADQRHRERVAVEEERARIARELHDIVAHNVGAIVVQAQGARRMLDREPERTREALEEIERTGRTALEEMRRSIGVLRRQGTDPPLAPQPGMAALDELVEQARRSGLSVELTTTGEPAELSAGVELSAYRIVQEALTNTLKHAGPVHARVRVEYHRRELALEITDDGASESAATAPGDDGHGLTGMRERVALYGGELHATPRPDGGFVVRASLPLAP